MSRIISLILLLCLASQISGKTFSQCELYNELLKQGFPRHQIKDWVCLVESESSRATHVVGNLNADGSLDYGLFQINSRYWCTTGGNPGNGCNVRCDDLLSDDISQASSCAKNIYGVHGFNAWVGWVRQCQGRYLPDLNC